MQSAPRPVAPGPSPGRGGHFRPGGRQYQSDSHVLAAGQRRSDDLDRRRVPGAYGHPLEIRLGAVSEGLDKREQHIADQIFQANEANQKAKDLLADYEKKLADSQNEVRAILEKGRRDAEQVGRAMLEKAKADANAEAQRMLKQIDAATTSAIKELADRSAALAVELAGKIVHARLNPKDHAKLIEQAVAGFQSRGVELFSGSRDECERIA